MFFLLVIHSWTFYCKLLVALKIFLTGSKLCLSMSILIVLLAAPVGEEATIFIKYVNMAYVITICTTNECSTIFFKFEMICYYSGHMVIAV